MKLTPIIIALFLISIFLACENNGVMFFAGDKDADDVKQDYDLEIDSKLPADGDADQELPEKDITDIEKSDKVESEKELEIENIPEIELETELEPELESEKELEIEVTVKIFPFDDTTIIPCQKEGEEPVGFSGYYWIWEDENGLIYFVGKSAFWIYNLYDNILTCDPNIEGYVYAIDGKVIGDKAEVWILQEKQIGRYFDGNWTFYTTPFNLEQGFSILNSLAINNNHIAAIFTESNKASFTIGLYSIHEKKWTISDACPGMISELNSRGYWVHDKFYVAGKNRLYSLSTNNFECQLEAQLDDGSKDSKYRIFGAKNDELWISSHINEDKSSHDYMSLQKVVTYNLKTKSVFSKYDFSQKYFFTLQNVNNPPFFIINYDRFFNNMFGCGSSTHLDLQLLNTSFSYEVGYAYNDAHCMNLGTSTFGLFFSYILNLSIKKNSKHFWLPYMGRTHFVSWTYPNQ